jgi:hypothetical protein
MESRRLRMQATPRGGNTTPRRRLPAFVVEFNKAIVLLLFGGRLPGFTILHFTVYYYVSDKILHLLYFITHYLHVSIMNFGMIHTFSGRRRL